MSINTKNQKNALFAESALDIENKRMVLLLPLDLPRIVSPSLPFYQFAFFRSPPPPRSHLFLSWLGDMLHMMAARLIWKTKKEK